MAIQFLRGTTNAINASTNTLKPGQPLLNTDTGCLYLDSDSRAIKSSHNFRYPSFNPANSYYDLTSKAAFAKTFMAVGVGNVWATEVALKSWGKDAELYIQYPFDTSMFSDMITTGTMYFYHNENGAHTAIKVDCTNLSSTVSSGYFKIKLNSAITINESIIKYTEVEGTLEQYVEILPLGYDGTKLCLSNTLLAYTDRDNNFSTTQTFNKGIKSNSVIVPSKKLLITTAGDTKLTSFQVKGHYGDFSITSVADWKDYGVCASGGVATLNKFVLNDYYAFPSIEDYRRLATERPVNSTAVSIPQESWTQVDEHHNAWTASGSISSDIPTELFGLEDSKLKIKLDLTVRSISVSSSSHTAYLAFYEDYVASGIPNVLTAVLDQVNIEPSLSTTYSGWVPAYWIAPAENYKRSMTMALISVKINTATASDSITVAQFYIQTTNFYQPLT